MVKSFVIIYLGTAPYIALKVIAVLEKRPDIWKLTYQLDVGCLNSSKISVHLYQATRCHSSEDAGLNLRRLPKTHSHKTQLSHCNRL